MAIVCATTLKEKERLRTGLCRLDETLNGGLPTQGIFEICGESGTGKTQWCLQLSVAIQEQREEGCVVYICTEDIFPSKRLTQILNNVPEEKKQVYSSNILIKHVSDFEELKECLDRGLSRLLMERKVSLVVIDSVAAIFRGTYAANEVNSRTNDLRCLGGILMNLNVNHDVFIVCVNQVTANLNSGETVPALGLAWANMVTTRVQLFRLHGNIRLFKILFSPCLPHVDGSFEITENGLKDPNVT